MATELKDSSTFAGKASVSGATFTGPLRGSGGISRDAQFYVDLANSATDPRINFDTNDHLDYSRANDTLSVSIGNNQVVSVNASGVLSSPGWACTSYGGLTLGKNSSTGRPYVTFDGPNSRIEFATGGAYVFYIGSVAVMSVDGNGNLKVRGGTPQINQTTFPS